MKPAVLTLPALAAGLVLVAGPGLADAHLLSLTPPLTMVQALAPPLAPPRAPVPRVLRLPSLTLPRVQPPSAFFGTRIPKSYLIFGLKSGPRGAFCTDRNGAALPMPFNPHVTLGPEQSFPRTYALPPAFRLPRFPALPAPKKLPQK